MSWAVLFLYTENFRETVFITGKCLWYYKHMKKLRVGGIVLLCIIVIGAAGFLIRKKFIQKKPAAPKSNVTVVSDEVQILRDYTDDKTKLAAMTPEQRTDQLLLKVVYQETAKDYKSAITTLKGIEKEGIPAGYEVGVYIHYVRVYGYLNDSKNKAIYEAKLKDALVAEGALGPNDPLPDINSGGTQ